MRREYGSIPYVCVSVVKTDTNSGETNGTYTVLVR